MPEPTSVATDRPCVVVAVEPRVYREVLAAALRTARPNVEVTECAGHRLNELLLSQRSDLVLASEPAERQGRQPPTRICLSSEGRRGAALMLAPQHLAVDNFTFESMLKVIDCILEWSRDPEKYLPAPLRALVSART
jgi:hypothetical protein